MKVPVRATRAYLAGFGTAGSLVAGAALLFLLGSAIVAFRGWPQIGGAPTTTVVAAARVSSPAEMAQRVAAVLRQRRLTRGAGAGRPRGATGARRGVHATQPRSAASGVAVHTGGTGAGSGASSAPTPGASSSPSASGASGCGSSCNQLAPQNAITQAGQNAITHVTHTVSQAVSDVGAQVGGQVTQDSGAVGGALGGTSPQVATAVQNVGSAAGSAVSDTTTTAGGVVSTVGGSLTGGH